MSDLLARVRNAKQQLKTEKELEQETLQHMREMMQNDEKQTQSRGESGQIPLFYRKKTPIPPLKQEATRAIRNTFLESKIQEVLSPSERQQLWSLLSSSAYTPETDKNEKQTGTAPVVTSPERQKMNHRISYDSFIAIRDKAPKSIQRCFRAAVFMRFPQDKYGHVSCGAVYAYMSRKAFLVKMRVALLQCDQLGHGYLTEKEAEDYVYTQLPQIAMRGYPPEFAEYYVYTVVAKFFFWLDPARKGRIKIKQLLHSSVFHSFRQFTMATAQTRKRSWFAPRNAWALYVSYLRLDQDDNGLLSKREFAEYNGGSLTSLFVDRYFEEKPMYLNERTGQLEMDYKMFLSFILAMECANTKPGTDADGGHVSAVTKTQITLCRITLLIILSTRFILIQVKHLFPVMDVHHRGYLTVGELNLFFREVDTIQCTENSS